MTYVRGLEARVKRKTVISNEEFEELLEKADALKPDFYRLRAKALLCLLRLTGKRRSEIAGLELDDFKVEEGKLVIHFQLLKKKRRFKECPQCGTRNTVKAVYCKSCGANIENAPVKKQGKMEDSFKAVPLSEPLARPIIEYLDYLNGLTPRPRYFFPSTKTLFGEAFIILSDKHLTGRQLFNIVRALSPNIWLHLFRETAASDIIRQDSSIIGAFKVMRRLDLESYQTGFNYLRRFASDIIQREVGKIES